MTIRELHAKLASLIARGHGDNPVFCCDVAEQHSEPLPLTGELVVHTGLSNIGRAAWREEVAQHTAADALLLGLRQEDI